MCVFVLSVIRYYEMYFVRTIVSLVVRIVLAFVHKDGQDTYSQKHDQSRTMDN